MLLAAGLRFYNLRQSPPGFNQDEAANAWNAWCLLKTGKDQHGETWPILYTRALGENKSTLYMYLLIPFQAIGGMNVITTRLVGAAGGVLTVLLIYFVGRRLFDRQTGLAAALLLALNPWHIQQSRWGHEASINALLGLAPLAMLLWANMPITCEKDCNPRPMRAIFAGAITGICCYSYHSVRIFVPIFLMAAGLATLPLWWRQIKTRKGAIAVGAYILGMGLTFGPLAWQHLFHPEGISRHSAFQHSLIVGQPILTVLKNVGWRYIQHFGPDFLFINGDHYQIQSPPNCGEFHWYMLPLIIAGIIFSIRTFRSFYASRILLVFMLVYPAGDCFFTSDGMHALRGSPGLCGLILTGAFGLICGIRRLAKQNRAAAKVTIFVFAVLAVVLNVRYLYHFYGEYNRRPEVYHGYYSDLVEACEWLRPVYNDKGIDAVFFSANGMGMAYIITLVCLNYDPDQWFRESRNFTTFDEFSFCTNYGKMGFMYGDSAKSIAEILPESNFQGDVIFIARPGEDELKNPVYVIRRPDGIATLEIYRLKARH